MKTLHIRYSKQAKEWQAKVTKSYAVEARGKTKMECITSNQNSKELGCQKKLCTHYK